MFPSKLRSLTFAVAALGSLALGTAARAETIYALTDSNALLSFDSNSPGTVSAPTTITGTTGGETIIDIDYFALNGQLYGVGASGTLYSINRATGVASVDVANAPVGTPVSIDFNPVTNQLGIISNNTTATANNGSNNANLGYRLTPSTGGASAGTVSSDGMFAYAASDSRNGAVPNLVGSAFTNNVNGATSTSLYSIDNPNPSGTGYLVQHQNGPGFTTLRTVAALSIPALGQSAFDPVNNTGFDISGATGMAYISEDFYKSGNGERLFLLNLTTGELDPSDGGQGLIGVTNGVRITSIAVVPEPGTWALCALGVIILCGLMRRRSAA